MTRDCSFYPAWRAMSSEVSDEVGWGETEADALADLEDAVGVARDSFIDESAVEFMPAVMCALRNGSDVCLGYGESPHAAFTDAREAWYMNASETWPDPLPDPDPTASFRAMGVRPLAPAPGWWSLHLWWDGHITYVQARVSDSGSLTDIVFGDISELLMPARCAAEKAAEAAIGGVRAVLAGARCPQWRLLDANGVECEITADPKQVQFFVESMMSDGLRFTVEPVLDSEEASP